MISLITLFCDALPPILISSFVGKFTTGTYLKYIIRKLSKTVLKKIADVNFTSLSSQKKERQLEIHSTKKIQRESASYVARCYVPCCVMLENRKVRTRLSNIGGGRFLTCKERD